MELEIFEPREINNDHPIRLSLNYTLDGDIMVVAVNENGRVIQRGHLIRFQSDGTIARHSNINEDLGFDLDRKGLIKIDTD